MDIFLIGQGRRGSRKIWWRDRQEPRWGLLVPVSDGLASNDGRQLDLSFLCSLLWHIWIFVFYRGLGHTVDANRMASTSLPRPRPLTPLEEDLQRLYNEVWQGFAEEEPAQSSERDLETIYNGYAGDYASPTTSSNTLQPQPPPPGMLSKFVDVFLFHGLLVSREPSPYRPPVETDNIPVTPNKPSPTRRRLPPTPGTSSSPFATMAMPEPHPFQPPDMPVAKP